MTDTQVNPAQNPISEREQLLTDQLAAILSKPPSKPHHPGKTTKQDLHQPILPEDFKTDFSYSCKNRDGRNDIKDDSSTIPAQSSKSSIQENDLSELEDNSPTNEDIPSHENAPQETAGAHHDIENTTIVKKTRHARFQKGARQAGSWAITLAVTVFITGCVSIMLFGLPKTLDLSTWITAQVTSPVSDAITPGK